MMADWGDMANMPGWMIGWMGLAGVLWLLIGIAGLALIVLAAIWLVRRLRAEAGRQSSALDELDRRYARGDLDREAYLQMKRDLSGK